MRGAYVPRWLREVSGFSPAYADAHLAASTRCQSVPSVPIGASWAQSGGHSQREYESFGESLAKSLGADARVGDGAKRRARRNPPWVGHFG